MVNKFEEECLHFGREKLRGLLAKCTEGQVGMFNRMYKSVNVIPLERINLAIQQCERTIVKNLDEL